jgi:hypothetical protein
MKLEDLLRHIADNIENGKEWFVELECKNLGNRPTWDDVVDHHDWFKLAPRTHMVNGFEVPAPDTVKPQKYTAIFNGDPSMKGWCIETAWHGTEIDLRMLERGNVFLTREAAIANAKAEKGINPYAEADK